MRNPCFSKLLLSSLFVIGSVVAAHAQSYSSFSQVTNLHGITLNKTVNNGVAAYTVSLASNAGYTLNNTNYSITNIFGFFELFDTPVASVIPSPPMSPSNWSEKDDIHGQSTTGQMFGYENNSKNNDITAGNSLGSFGFLNAPSPSSFGFHVTAGNGNTYFIKGSLTSTPEASSVIGFGALLCGGLLALRVKKQRYNAQ